jgi:predicted flap endonuclease-1-like 5' DNA nuclease
MTRIIDIEGIGAVYTEKLHQHGVRTTERLLRIGATKKGREDLAEMSGISEKLILEWVNLADLMRVRGIGSEYSDLLEEAGVDTVKELRNRRPDNLYQALVKVNKEKKLVRRIPSEKEVKDWVSQAKTLPPAVTY